MLVDEGGVALIRGRVGRGAKIIKINDVVRMTCKINLIFSNFLLSMGLPNKLKMRTYYKEAQESFTNISTLFLPPQL